MSPRSFLIAAALAFALVASFSPVDAQEGSVVGVVTDETGVPVAGASVVLVGTGIATITDTEGGFSLSAEPGTYRVQVRLIGYGQLIQSVSISDSEVTRLELVLSRMAVPLEDLVATVAAVAERRDRVGTDIERVDVTRALERFSQPTLSDLINTRAPGVTITRASGEVGTASQIRVRAATSLTQDNTPLVYLDGIRISNEVAGGPDNVFFVGGQTISRLDDISPEDIASVQVVKGPSATALYGAEAAAGVLIIETKKGRDAPRFTAMTEQGVSYDANDYPDIYMNLTANAGVTDVNDPTFQQWRPVQNPVTGDVFARTNPLKDALTSPFRTARVSRYNVTASGSEESVDFFLSASYDDMQGTLPVQGVERFSGRANLTYRPFETLDLSISSNYMKRDTDLAVNNRDIFGWITNGGVGLPLFSFGTRPDGSRGDCMATLIAGMPESVCETQQGNFFTSFDNLARVAQGQSMDRIITSAILSHRPTDWFSQRFTVGVDFTETQDQNVIPRDPVAFPGFGDGFVNEIRSDDEIISLDYAGTVSLQPTEGLSSSTTIGGQFFRASRKQVGCAGQGLASETAIACNSALTFQGFSDVFEVREAGGFLQQSLGFDDVLFVTGALRVDDSSSFGEEESAIVSPSAHASWVVSRMPFWNVKPVDELRLRLAWGKAAQAPAPFVADFAFQPTRFEKDGADLIGVTTFRPGNPELTAERNEEIEMGLDAAVLENRVNLKFTYYRQKVTNAILRVPSPPSFGFNAPRFGNIGAVENKGFEAALGARVLDRANINWDIDLSLSTNDPVITSLGGQPPFATCGQPPGRDDQGLFVEGLPPGTGCGIVVESAERDENGNIIPESIQFAPSDVDLGIPNLRALGRQEPSNSQTLSTTLTLFRALRLYTLFDRRGGYVKFDQNRHFLNPFIEGLSEHRLFAFRQVESTPEEQAMLELGRGLGIPSIAVATQQADFIRWRELSASYELPRQLLSSIGLGVQRGSLTVGISNVALWTDYEGVDPEVRVAGGADTFNTMDFMSQGPARSITARLSLSF